MKSRSTPQYLLLPFIATTNKTFVGITHRLRIFPLSKEKPGTCSRLPLKEARPRHWLASPLRRGISTEGPKVECTLRIGGIRYQISEVSSDMDSLFFISNDSGLSRKPPCPHEDLRTKPNHLCNPQTPLNTRTSCRKRDFLFSTHTPKGLIEKNRDVWNSTPSPACKGKQKLSSGLLPYEKNIPADTTSLPLIHSCLC